VNIKRLLFLLFLIPISVFAQRQYDVGIYAGASYYMGEMNPSQQFNDAGRNYGILYRYIFNKRYAVKAQVNRAILKGGTSSNSSFPENSSFNNHNDFKHKILDFSIQAEFNFLPYNTTDLKDRYTPYVTTGISGLIFPVGLNLPIAIPFGIGLKYNYNKRIGVGFEWTFKRTFDDEWDYNGEYIGRLVHDDVNNRDILVKQNAFQYNKDWYSFVGLFLTYKFDESFECPAYD